MARTTDALVRQIIDIDESITNLDPFISAANIMVTKHCLDIDDDVGEVVETWLAAHFVTIRDMRSSNEAVTGTTGASQSFQYKLSLGLSCSMYGQTAMNIDTTGGLARWNTSVLDGKAGKTVGAAWLGTEIEA